MSGRGAGSAGEQRGELGGLAVGGVNVCSYYPYEEHWGQNKEG